MTRIALAVAVGVFIGVWAGLLLYAMRFEFDCTMRVLRHI